MNIMWQESKIRKGAIRKVRTEDLHPEYLLVGLVVDFIQYIFNLPALLPWPCPDCFKS